MFEWFHIDLRRSKKTNNTKRVCDYVRLRKVLKYGSYFNNIPCGTKNINNCMQISTHFCKENQIERDFIITGIIQGMNVNHCSKNI